MPKIISNPEVDRPTPDRLSSSLLDHATVKEIDHFGLRNPDGLWPSYNAVLGLIPITLCPDPFTGYKVFDSAEWVDSYEFGLYSGSQCLAVGLDWADQKSETRRVFEAMEGLGVERALREEVFGVSIPVSTLTEGIPLAAAVGLLEGYMASGHYVGVPTIHMPRAAAVVLLGSGVLVERDGKFYTKTGAKVAAGGGYDADLIDGDWAMYISGEVYVERSQIIHEQQMVLPGDGSGLESDENQLSDNTVVTLVERMYRVAVDGPVFKVIARGWPA